MRNLSEIFVDAFADSIQAAGFSTVSLPNNLLEHCQELRPRLDVDRFELQNIASIVPVTNFKTVHRSYWRFRIRAVPRGGDILHGETGEVVTRKGRHIRCETLRSTAPTLSTTTSARDQRSTAPGRGAALALNKIFWAAYLTNSSPLPAAITTYAPAAAPLLGLAGLQAAEAVLRKQTDPDGEPLGLSEPFCRVPVNSKPRRCTDELGIHDWSDRHRDVWGNPFKGCFDVQSRPDTWNARSPHTAPPRRYLLAGPAALGTVEVALTMVALRRLWNSRADFGTLGVQMRGYHDFGVSMNDSAVVSERWFMTLF